jgi:cytochrome d ubiquinol oxidase subunit I
LATNSCGFDAALICGAFFMAGIAAYYLIKKQHIDFAKPALKVAVIFGLTASMLELFPFGHEHARQVAHTQPEKFAAIEGLYTSQNGAPLVLFAYPVDRPPELKAPIEIPGLLSWMVFGDSEAKILGLNEFPENERPPLWLTFVSFHNMVILGIYFILVMFWASVSLYRKKIWENKKLLKILIWSIPLPVIACQLGWIAAEVGRQPWIVYKLLRTSDAVSVTVPAGNILFSMIIFGLIYILLGVLYIYLIIRKVKHGPEPISGKEVTG